MTLTLTQHIKDCSKSASSPFLESFSFRRSAQEIRLLLLRRARALRDDQVSFIGFGSFEPRARAARTGRNPKTGEALQIAASTAVGFSASKVLKEAVNNKGMTP